MELARILQDLYSKNNTTIVVTGSMSPRIRVGDKVKIQPGAAPSFGDVALFISNNTLVLHRYYFRFSNKAITRGDNQVFFDKPWNFSMYIGKAIMNISIKERMCCVLAIIKALPRIALKSKWRQMLE